MSVQDKLQKGRDLLNKAGNDLDLLGLALTSMHGALEDACRDWLSEPSIQRQHGVAMQGESKASWKHLPELMSKYCGWSDQDVRYVRKMNGLRNKVAHGDRFSSSYQEIAEYLEFVERVIASGGSTDGSKSEQTGKPYFSYTRSQKTVKPFRFCIKRTGTGIEIRNRKGARVITAYAAGVDKQSLTSAASNLRRLLGRIRSKEAYVQTNAIKTAVTASLGFLAVMVLLPTLLPILLLLLYIQISGARFPGSKASLMELLLPSTVVLVTCSEVYVGKRAYHAPSSTHFQTIPSIGGGYKLYFLTANGAVYFGRDLTWEEADELIKAICAAANYDSSEQRAQFSVDARDQLIYFNSHKTQHSFVLQYNARLWQSLRCRTVEKKVVELTRSELEELYGMKLQSFN